MSESPFEADHAAGRASLTVRTERREGWGMASEALCEVVRPRSAQDVLDAYALARERGWTVSQQGNGRSYGDAALNESNLLLDFSGMDRILSWDPREGVAVVEPGVTLSKLWRHTLPDGWWPKVVSGTMFTSVGGLAAANAHGKNNTKYGPFGECIEAFTFVSPDGQIREVTPESDPNLFHAAIGGYGWLGSFVSFKLRLKKVHSGRLEVHALPCDDLDEMFAGFERYLAEKQDYVVGWIDAYARGSGFGRGQIHAARYLKPDEDVPGLRLMDASSQELPERMFGILPFGWLHWFARPFANRWGMRLINFGRYWWMKLREGSNHAHLQPHAQFNFLLDFVPNWKWFSKPGGLIQFQLFLPKDQAKDAFRRAIEMAQAAGHEPYLVVMKRHRPDAFWLSHAVDGYSFAMDFFVTDRGREDLYQLTRRMTELVVAAGGRFYPAKDSVVPGAALRQTLGDEVWARFFALKRQLDPGNLIRGSQFRRYFGEGMTGLPELGTVEPGWRPPGAPAVEVSPPAEPASVASAPDQPELPPAPPPEAGEAPPAS